jgi:serine/threonine-protein kinase
VSSDPARHWIKVKRLFAAALEEAPAGRAAFVAQASGGDAALRDELETLLAAHDHPEGLLDSPPASLEADDPAQAERLAPGARIGPYEIVDLLGEGGMGQVYRAQDARLGREVALKVLSPGKRGEEALRRFEQEARAAGSLNHPNILSVHDIGIHEGAPYIVTELLQGTTLRARMAGKPLPLATALDYATQLAQGLSAAHSKGIIHRDLKPENLFVTGEGRLKILDFGIAKMTPSAAAAANEPHPAAMGSGPLLGTVNYMAPEQVEGRSAGYRSDIFSAGVIVYEMLAGELSCPADSALESGSPIAMPAPVPTGVRQIVRRCLEKDPQDRFADGRELALALERLSTARSGGRRRAALLAGSGLLLALGLAALFGRGFLRRTNRPPTASIAVLPFVDMSPGKDQEHFSDGVAEEILHALARLAGLHLAGRTSSFSFKGKSEDLRSIGQELNVAHVLEGSVRKEGNRVRVTAQLVDAASGYHI